MKYAGVVRLRLHVERGRTGTGSTRRTACNGPYLRFGGLVDLRIDFHPLRQILAVITGRSVVERRRSQAVIDAPIACAQVLCYVAAERGARGRSTGGPDDDGAVKTHFDLQVRLGPAQVTVRAGCGSHQGVSDRAAGSRFLRQQTRHTTTDAHHLQTREKQRSIPRRSRQIVGQCHRERNILGDHQRGRRNLHCGTERACGIRHERGRGARRASVTPGIDLGAVGLRDVALPGNQIERSSASCARDAGHRRLDRSREQQGRCRTDQDTDGPREDALRVVIDRIHRCLSYLTTTSVISPPKSPRRSTGGQDSACRGSKCPGQFRCCRESRPSTLHRPA